MLTFSPAKSRLALLAGLVLLPLPSAFALGFRIPNQDAEAIGRGSAFVATANNPAALYYNPAGITQLEGHHIQLGVLNYLSLLNEYESPSGHREETTGEWVPVPQLNYTFSPKESAFSYGLGFYSPYGLKMRWAENNSFRALAIEGKLTYYTVNPTVAWQLHPTLSLAAGPTINHSSLNLRRGLGVAPGDQFTFRGDDTDLGYHLGLLWQPHQQWSFGANYRSATTLNYDGTFDYQGPAPAVSSSGRVEFPQNVAFGVSFRPTTNWNVEIDADWTDWDTLNTVTLKNTTFGTLPLALNWQSSWFYHFGVTRELSHGYYASAGYFFSENSTSDRNFNPIVPDTDLHVGSLGVGRRGEHWDWAVAAQMIAGGWRDVEGSLPAINGESANGRYRWFVPTLSASVGYHF